MTIKTQPPAKTVRCLEITVAGLMLILLWIPFLIFRFWRGHPEFQNNTWVGIDTKRFNFSLQEDWEDKQLFSPQAFLLWWKVFRGTLALVGPHPKTVSQFFELSPLHRMRIQSRPGLLNRHKIQKALNIDFQSEEDLAITPGDFKGLACVIAIIFRSIFSSIYQPNHRLSIQPRVSMFGLKLENVDQNTILKQLMKRVINGKKTHLTFVNPHGINLALENQDYLNCLKSADFRFPDGIGLHLGAKAMGQRLHYNLNGTDLFNPLCSKLSEHQLKAYFLGAKRGVTEDLVQSLAQSHPHLMVSGYRNGYFNEQDEWEIIENINKSGADILFVGMGAPKQDLWIKRNLCKLNVKLALGVGGCFDFHSGHTKRAPLWLRELGLEWCFRLFIEPRRMWRRYLIGNAVFMFRAFRNS